MFTSVLVQLWQQGRQSEARLLVSNFPKNSAADKNPLLISTPSNTSNNDLKKKKIYNTMSVTKLSIPGKSLPQRFLVMQVFQSNWNSDV